MGELRAQGMHHDLRFDQEGYLSLIVVCTQLTDSFSVAHGPHQPITRAVPLHARVIWQYLGELRAQGMHHDLRTDQEVYLALFVACMQLTDSFTVDVTVHSTSYARE